MEHLSAKMFEKKERPVRILQYGEGNFLRAFTDCLIDEANEKGLFDGDIVIVKPRSSGNLDRFKEQDCCYTVSFQGLDNGEAKVTERVVTSVKEALSAYGDYDKYMSYAHVDTLKFIVSNTTEAGIVYDAADRFEDKPQNSYPGKLCRFLYERYCFFNGAEDRGLIILPVELIDNNGGELEKCVKLHAKDWNLGEGFTEWLDRTCVFASTLVDRIVSGYPKESAEELFEKWGYRDELAVVAEPYGLWIIEACKDISGEFGLKDGNAGIVFADNLKAYKKRKVRILNGAHTSFVPASFLAGNDYVRQSMEDETVYNFMKKTLSEEIIPALVTDEEKIHEKETTTFDRVAFETECRQFAEDVIIRFKNPYVKHMHMSIALNSVSKWRTRCLPSLEDYVKYFGKLPGNLTFSLAALMALYTGNELRDGFLICFRNGEEYTISDNPAVLGFFAEHSEKDEEAFVKAFLAREDFWGYDLNSIPGVAEAVIGYLKKIRSNGIRSVMEG